MNFVLLDVAIGLSTVFALVALMCAGLQELIAAMLNLRGETLWEGVQSILLAGHKMDINRPKSAADRDKDPGGAIEEAMRSHPLIVGQVSDKFGLPDLFRWAFGSRRPTSNIGSSKPSYLDSTTFANALCETIQQVYEVQGHGFADFAQTVSKLPDGPLKKTLQSFVMHARGDAEQTRRAVENWYDEAMERVSGWYKRRTQAMLFLVGFAVAIGLNVDSLHIANQLWKEPTLRAAMVAQATKVSEAKAHDNLHGDDLINQARNDLENLSSSLPIGWPAESWPKGEPPKAGIWDRVTWTVVQIYEQAGEAFLLFVGWLITAGAVSFGAPFWFDLLGRLIPLRSTGAKPASTPDDKTTKDRPPSTNALPPTPQTMVATSNPASTTSPGSFRYALNDYEVQALDDPAVIAIKKKLGVPNPSASTGLLDQVTRDAIRAAQQQRGLPETGQLSAMLVNAVMVP